MTDQKDKGIQAVAKGLGIGLIMSVSAMSAANAKNSQGFSATPLTKGYMVLADSHQEKGGEMKCGNGNCANSDNGSSDDSHDDNHGTQNSNGDDEPANGNAKKGHRAGKCGHGKCG